MYTGCPFTQSLLFRHNLRNLLNVGSCERKTFRTPWQTLDKLSKKIKTQTLFFRKKELSWRKGKPFISSILPVAYSWGCCLSGSSSIQSYKYSISHIYLSEQYNYGCDINRSVNALPPAEIILKIGIWTQAQERWRDGGERNNAAKIHCDIASIWQLVWGGILHGEGMTTFSGLGNTFT